jgi:ABC-2 type transport system ATP-binding protein
MSPPAIQTHGLTKQFENQSAVSDLNLQIDAGEVYGLIGPNGAGKTTLIRMLATADEPTMGRIEIFGQTLQPQSRNADIKRRIGYLPDDFPLYDDLSVWDYLDYFARMYFLVSPHRDERLQEVLDLVNLGEKKDARIATLSRGMKQRLSLARTVIYEPSLLLLDEPVSGLDPIARIQFRDAIRGLQQKGMTILISSHILSDLEEMCSSIGIMERGKLVESSRLTDLYHRSEVQTILITTLRGLKELEEAIPRHPLVENVLLLSDQKTLKVAFKGGEEESAQLLQTLMNAKFPISSFHRTQEDLESIFLKMGYEKTA